MVDQQCFTCESCKKSFKRKAHLLNNVKVCNPTKMNKERNFVCDKCDKKFLLKHHATRHMKICINGKSEYFCKLCDEVVLVKNKIQHEKTQHNKFYCDFCDYVGHRNHKRRHTRAKHKGMTPARTVMAKEKKKFICDICEKEYFDNSTLHKHNKRKHLIKINEVKEKDIFKKENVINTIVKQTKNVNFKENIQEVVEIPYTKALVRGKEDEIVEMFSSIESIMTLFTNRKQLVTTNELINSVQMLTKQTFDIHIFRILVSLDMYCVQLVNGDLIVTVFEEKITPIIVKKRLSNLKSKLNECQNYLYLDLINFPERKVEKYQSAKDVIEDNIIKFDITEEVSDDDEEYFKEIKNISTSLLKMVKQKIKLKRIREKKFKQIDFQKNSMPELARIVNSIYIGEKRLTLQKSTLVEHIKYSRYSTIRKIEDDLNRLISLSDGWLKVMYKDWVRKNRMIDINTLCELLIS